jgi:hypothetical protein
MTSKSTLFAQHRSVREGIRQTHEMHCFVNNVSFSTWFLSRSPRQKSSCIYLALGLGCVSCCRTFLENIKISRAFYSVTHAITINIFGRAYFWQRKMWRYRPLIIEIHKKILRLFQFPFWLPLEHGPSMKLPISLQLLHLGKSVGLLGRVISSSQDLYLHRTIQT